VAALEVRPWTDEQTGIVDVELGRPPASWRELQRRFGPFQEVPGFDVGAQTFAARPGHDSGDRVLLLVQPVGDEVAGITVRRDPT
jgi:hypothetical protein